MRKFEQGAFYLLVIIYLVILGLVTFISGGTDGL